MRFLNRWKIEGTLTTQTPLRIGDGGDIKASKRGHCDYLIDKDAKPPVKPSINTVALDNNKKPYIPASAIKGNLRTWAENVLTEPEIEIIFGSSKNTDPEKLKAGKVQFSNAYFQSPYGNFSNLAGWNSDRLTAVSVGIAVNRKTRAASDKKLFYQEYVPEGITFKFELSGNDNKVTDKDEDDFKKKVANYSEEKKAKAIIKFQKYRDENNKLLNDEGIKKLLVLLNGFANGLTIGAETVEADESWGILTWQLGEVKRTNPESLQTWFESIDERGKIPFEKVETKYWEIEPIITASNQTLEMSLSLQCLDDFLVNDPSKTKTKEEQKDPDNKKPNHSPLRNKDGKPILPKSSIKGAIRSQAERILRTMAIKLNVNMTDEELKKIACYPDDMKHACKPIKQAEEVQGLCLACQLFGASGWKSPISFTDFIGDKSIFVERKVNTDDLFPKRREFVAIDRFTGGVSGSGKFNADVAHRPELTGKISIDFERLEKCRAKDWAIGLLALTFRDLLEGDIRLGFGRAKGFGEIKAKINNSEAIVDIFDKTEQVLIDAVKTLESEIGGKINGIS